MIYAAISFGVFETPRGFFPSPDRVVLSLRAAISAVCLCQCRSVRSAGQSGWSGGAGYLAGTSRPIDRAGWAKKTPAVEPRAGGKNVGGAGPIRVLIIDDYQIYAQGIEDCLNGEPGITCVGIARPGLEAIAAIADLAPDVVVLDVFQPGHGMPSLAQRIRDLYPDVAMLALGEPDMDLVALKLVRVGVDGYLLKDCDRSELARAVRIVHRGEAFFTPIVARTLVRHLRLLSSATGRGRRAASGLTQREHRVLDLLGRGRSNREIADLLGLSERTVENHARSIYNKLNVRDRAQAILIAQQQGYLQLEGGEGDLDQPRPVPWSG